VHYLIDGYNLIRQVPELQAAEAESLEAGREALLSRLDIFRRRHPATRITVVFDGPAGVFPPAGGPAGVRVLYSRGRKADDWIKELIDASDDPGELVVVSADREVVDYARLARCRIQAPLPFSRRFFEVPKAADRKPLIEPKGLHRIEEELRRRWIRKDGR